MMLYNCKNVHQDVDVRTSASCFEKFDVEYQDKSYRYAISGTFRFLYLLYDEQTYQLTFLFVSRNVKLVD